MSPVSAPAAAYAVNDIAQVLTPYAAISLIPAVLALARRKLIPASLLALVGLAITVGGWVWVLIFPGLFGGGIAYALTPITIFGGPAFAIIGSPFALFYDTRRRGTR